jgi:hypothetical protein
MTAAGLIMQDKMNVKEFAGQVVSLQELRLTSGALLVIAYSVRLWVPLQRPQLRRRVCYFQPGAAASMRVNLGLELMNAFGAGVRNATRNLFSF